MADKEKWFDIPEFKGQYQISNLSRIRRMYVMTKHGNLSNNVYYPKKSYNSDGYEIYFIKGKIYKMHRLLAEMFILNPDNKPQINHINGIKSDNRIENLEWCTLQENINHYYEKLLINRNKVLTEDQLKEIKNLHGKISNRKIAKIYNVSHDTINRKIKELTT